MGLIYTDMSMSLDGFIAGPNVSVANGMGDGGERLRDWMFAGKSDEEGDAWEVKQFASTGAASTAGGSALAIARRIVSR